MYYEVRIDHKVVGVFNGKEKDVFVRENKNKCHLLTITRFNNQHQSVGCEDYLDGKLICKL